MSSTNVGHSFVTHDGNNTTFRYALGAEYPDIRLWWVNDQENLINFSSGYTFTLVISRGVTTYLTKTTNIVGAAGSGNPDTGTPNLTISWAAGELASPLNPGVYRVDLTATSGGKDRFQTFTLVLDSPSDVTWTYSGDPASADKDAVRYLIGDTEVQDQLLSDQEVLWSLSQRGDVYSSAAECCLTIAARFARLVDRSVGGLSVTFSRKHEQYKSMAEELRRNVGNDPVAPWASGWDIAEMNGRDADSSRQRTFATKGMHNNPGTVSDDDFAQRFGDRWNT